MFYELRSEIKKIQYRGAIQLETILFICKYETCGCRLFIICSEIVSAVV